jgi:Fe-S cluster assembly protein SufD
MQLFEQRVSNAAPSQPPWLKNLRRSAMRHFSEWGLPESQHEEWRYTSLNVLREWPCRLADPAPEPTESDLRSVLFAEGFDCDRLVFLNGRFQAGLSRWASMPNGVILVPLSQAWDRSLPAVEAHLGHHADPKDSSLVSLNTALFTDGALVVIPAGLRLARPVQILHLSDATEPGISVQTRNLILAGANSEGVVIEHFAALNDRPVFTNTVSELVLDEGAILDHAHQAARSVFRSHSMSVGARLARHNIHTRLDGEGAESLLNGLYLAHGDQLVDHHTAIDHIRPNCNSHEFYHGIIAGRGKGVFSGKIFVRPGAQKTNARQTNRNLLLSADATVDTKPQLEIFADDVKCTHGATVGHLDDEPLFYLRSRGIGLATARQILVHAFANEVIHRVPIPQLADAWDRFLLGRWDQSPTVEAGST